ncbi:hypothetical protein [Devosia sp. XK-2]|uniref:hypothetical protein n=1 Tax=Devosia sp. XK-2 TaxID=3126689 RepID=UPI0030D04145
MGELLDRAFQRELLSDLRNLYPHAADIKRSYGEQSDNRLLVNLYYLDEHELIDLKATQFVDGSIKPHHAKITAKGMDFLADDGGLSAILGVVVVKFHEDTVRGMLLEKIAQSQGEEGVKASLVEKIRNLPADALGKVAERALEAGLESLPNAVEWLVGILPK